MELMETMAKMALRDPKDPKDPKERQDVAVAWCRARTAVNALMAKRRICSVFVDVLYLAKRCLSLEVVNAYLALS